MRLPSRDSVDVVSIGKLGGGPQAGRYYTDAVAKGREDYYAGTGEAEGEWLGQGAQMLGLTGAVSADDFAAALQGRAPGGGELRPAPRADGVAGFDVTFSAPKSVSVLFGVGDETHARAAREAHDRAVRQALGYLEREACRTRRGRGGARRLPGDGLVVAAFRHRSSRAGDPQLHTHAIVVNATHAEGRWSTLDSRAVFAHARTAGFLYQAALRTELERALGVEWREVERGVAELEGVPPEVLRHFSRRRLEIEAQLLERGERSARAAQAAALDTRRRKDYDVPTDRLREEWRARASEHGLEQRDLAGLVGRRLASDRAIELDGDQLAGEEGVTREVSTFDRRDVLRALAEQQRQGAPVDELERLADEWLGSVDAVDLGTAGVAGLQRYSTPELLAAERSLLDDAEQRRGEGAGLADEGQLDRALAQRPALAAEQTELVRSLTRSGDGVQVVRAPAGTGKTFALEAARDAWEASGRRVFGCALSARAAVELQSQAGVDSSTIAQLQLDLERGYGLDERCVLVVDEAGMVGTRTLHQLAAHASATGAKLVLVGDDRQLPEIQAGGGFGTLARRLEALELRTVRRQEHEWDREALGALRDGDLTLWATRYTEEGRVVARSNAREVRERLVADWWQAARDDERDAVMLAHRRTDVQELNERARALMRAEGHLGDVEVEVGERAFAAGDHVLARHNDRRLGVVNGARGVVREVDAHRASVTVAFGTGNEVELPSLYLQNGHLDHGYALTAHAAQGATVDRSFVLGSDDLYREWGYTALSRHRESARFYVVSPGSVERALPGLEPDRDPLLDDLAVVLGQSRLKHLALDELDSAVDLGRVEADRELLEQCRTIDTAVRRAERKHVRAVAACDDVRERAETRGDDGLLARWRRQREDRHGDDRERTVRLWEQAATEAGEQLAAAQGERSAWLEDHGDACVAAYERLIQAEDRLPHAEADRARELLAELRPPLSVLERDDWAANALTAQRSYEQAALDLE